MMKYMVRKNFWDNNRLVGINTRFLFSSAMLMASQIISKIQINIIFW